MTRIPALIVTAVSLIAVTGCNVSVDVQSGENASTEIAEIDAVFAAWDKPGSPGCGIAVAQDGDLVYSRGYGYANLDYDIPITSQTVFDVASVTKQFNAASLTMLELEGKLSLEDDVRKWLPELPEFESPVTLQHMIYHTSGLRDYLNLFPLSGRDDFHPISHRQIRDMMSRQRALNFQPGDEYSYSNTAYMLLAQVVERASGQSFGDFTQARIFAPLKMAGSRMYDNKEEIIPHRSIGYELTVDGNSRIVHNWNFDVAGDGQLYSTMEDLLRWDNYLHGANKPAIHAQMLVEGTLNNGEPTGYAQGLRLDEHRGLRRVGHGGSSWGFRTELVRYLDAGLSMAISCNFNSANPQAFARQVAEYYLGEQMQPEPMDGQGELEQDEQDEGSAAPMLTAEQFREYLGSYFSAELDAIYRITYVDDGLVLRIEQQPPVDMQPVADDSFEFELHPDGWGGPSTVRLDFKRNDDGAMRGFNLSAAAEQGIVFTRN